MQALPTAGGGCGCCTVLANAVSLGKVEDMRVQQFAVVARPAARPVPVWRAITPGGLSGGRNESVCRFQ